MSANAISAELQAKIGETMVALGLTDDAAAVVAERLHGGASNENFLVTAPAGPAVLRIAAPLTHGERFGLDRWRGFVAHRAAQDVGVAPALLGIALPSGNSVVEFVDGAVLEPEDMTDGTNLEDVAHALARVHRSGADCGTFDAGDEVTRFRRISRDESLWLPDDIDDLTRLCDEVGAVLGRTDMPSVLGHNDLQIANLIRGRDGAISIIDWEYAGRNNPYFDLAMLVSNAALDADHTERLALAYFGEVRSADLARIQLERFRSAMRESLWSIIAQPVLDTGWDFHAWALQFLDAARATRDVIHRDGLLAVADSKGP